HDGRIKLKRNTSPDGQHHYVPLSDVARVDEHVHLSRTAADVRSGFLTAGSATTGPAATTSATTTHATHGAREVHVEEKSRNWLPWILGALALLALLIFGLRSCDNEPAAVAPAPVDTTAVPVETDVAVAVAEESVTLPGGGTVALAPQTIGYDLQRYLASNEAAPRTFQFERLNFDTARSDIRAVDRPTVDGIARILVAYPAARVRLIGYADARGDAGANANLGADRARAVAAALTAGGVAANRIETATGGETAATDSNATSQGQAENRRTELIVLAK
ncbi:MAG: hypothetical protein AVDCRST_MAG91-1345, partial [uncultured Sphingomonadaceae bacterium]